MREHPPHVSDEEVLAAVRTHWDDDAADVEHLPVGFGAYHWQVRVRGRPALFVTLDALGARHDARSLEAAYAGAAELAFRLDFVVAGLPSAGLTYTVPLAGGALSCTPWVWGERPPESPATIAATATTLSRLHAVTPPAGLPRWEPLVPPDLGDRLAASVATPWDGGPLGEQARTAVSAGLDDVRARIDRYLTLAESSADRSWVVTHGEPHVRNQLATPVRTLLIDWESVRLAPAERDLRWLPEPAGADPGMLTLFDLEWHLDEVAQYAGRFAAPHPGGPDDETALAGLLAELRRVGG